MMIMKDHAKYCWWRWSLGKVALVKTTRGAEKWWCRRQGNEDDDDEDASLQATTGTMVTMASLKPRILMTITLEERSVTMVTLEARGMANTGDASSWKGLKLLRTHIPRWRKHEGKDEEGDKIDWNENTRLMCQWLVLNPLERDQGNKNETESDGFKCV